MAVQYAKSYIDRAFDSNDVFTLYDVIRVLDAERELDEPLRLFLRLWEWAWSTRSGMWQYYENVVLADFDEIAKMMDRCELTEIATRYRAGMDCWEEPRYCDDLDVWIETYESMLEEISMQLIKPHREQLYPTKN
ncbi:hypothetical protein LOC71_18860 [Rhodopirellula sp. JC740]|uniref:DUF4375 domain-containing protein n=1 Tax=Rhodopirellula halodulae TaxID=2894198 RepID=A0ABS8NLA8_9BACT|nr:hypothetical protein [Rhodopirellula sp. JC740]MCC9644343.1 hypothetical protein [Rhodopirellula sp. JC740]